MNKKTIISLLLIVGVYLISTGISYALFPRGFSKNKPVVSKYQVTSSGSVKFDQSLPKTEACPLNGEFYSKEQRDWWQKHRPLGVMIENHQEARPQSGLSSADVIYEAVAEGGITRFLAVFYCQDAEYIGPIRSARTYFLDWISEYGDYPLYAHVGGANTAGPADALSQITEYGWTLYNDLNQFRIGCPIYCQLLNRLGDGNIAIEHTMYSSTTKLLDFAKSKHKLTNIDKEGNSWDAGFAKYEFKEDVPSSARSSKQIINLEFWEGYGQYSVDWIYDSLSNLYKRNSGGAVHLDKNNDKQLVAKNVAVLFMRESNANDGYENNAHLLYKTKGTGKAFVFMDGKKTVATWRKESRTGRTLLFDENGTAIKFNRGKIWFEILPIDGKVVEK